MTNTVCVYACVCLCLCMCVLCIFKNSTIGHSQLPGEATKCLKKCSNSFSAGGLCPPGPPSRALPLHPTRAQAAPGPQPGFSSSFLKQFPRLTYHQQLQIQTRHIQRWLTSVKLGCKVDVHWFNKLFGSVRTSCMLKPWK